MAEAPPPCYEAVVGAHTLTGFRDFWPQPVEYDPKAKHATFEKFECLMKEANCYLKSHPHQAAFSIETIEKRVYETEEIYKTILLYKPKGQSATWIKGLRLWLTKNLSTEPQSLWYTDVVPRKISTDDPEQEADGYLSFENFQEVINSFNRRITANALPGRILSIQTVPLNICKMEWKYHSFGVFRTDHCAWVDEFKYHRFHILRVFYEQGVPRQEQIGIADFAPQLLHEAGLFESKPKMTDFEHVVSRAALWMKNFTGVRVTNLQTVEIKYYSPGESHVSATLMSMDYNMHRGNRCTFLRIAYVQAEPGTIPKAPRLSYCSFYPLHNYNQETNNWETLMQSQQRLQTWLRRTDVRFICIETVYMPSSVHKNHPERDKTVHDGDWYVVNSDSGSDYCRHKMLQHIRLYMDGVQQLPPEQDSKTSFNADEEYDRNGCILL